MADQEGKVFRKTEIVGTSTVGWDDAGKRAIARAMKTLRNVSWFEVKEHRGRITGSADNFQLEFKEQRKTLARKKSPILDGTARIL